MDEMHAFLSELTAGDTGREEIAGRVLRFEGFTDLCIQDAVARTRLPPADARHLTSFEAVYDEVLAGWSEEEGKPVIDTGFCGSSENPIIWALY